MAGLGREGGDADKPHGTKKRRRGVCPRKAPLDGSTALDRRSYVSLPVWTPTRSTNAEAALVRRRPAGAAAVSSPMERLGPRPEGHGPASDLALVERAKAGDHEAFGALYERHACEVRAFIASRASSGVSTDDIAGATWLTAWSALVQYENDGRPFVPWVI